MEKKKKKKRETTNLNFSIVSVVSLLSALLVLQKYLISNTPAVRSIQHFCLDAILKKNACKMYCRECPATPAKFRVQCQA